MEYQIPLKAETERVLKTDGLYERLYNKKTGTHILDPMLPFQITTNILISYSSWKYIFIYWKNWSKAALEFGGSSFFSRCIMHIIEIWGPVKVKPLVAFPVLDPTRISLIIHKTCTKITTRPQCCLMCLS